MSTGRMTIAQAMGVRMGPIIIMFSKFGPVPDWVNARMAPNSLRVGRVYPRRATDVARRRLFGVAFFNRRCAQTISVEEPYRKIDKASTNYRNLLFNRVVETGYRAGLSKAIGDPSSLPSLRAPR